MDAPRDDGARAADPQEGTGPGASRRKAAPREWMRRLAWLAALWLGGVFTLATVAYVIRTFMHAMGMH